MKKEEDEIRRLQEKGGLNNKILDDKFPVSNFFYYNTVLFDKISIDKKMMINNCPLIKRVYETIKIYDRDDDSKNNDLDSKSEEEYWLLKSTLSLRQRIHFLEKSEQKSEERFGEGKSNEGKEVKVAEILEVKNEK
jgi:hypothetical protein